MTDTERLNYLIEFEAYSYLTSSFYGPEWYRRSRFELVRETIDMAIKATMDEEQSDRLEEIKG